MTKNTIQNLLDNKQMVLEGFKLILPVAISFFTVSATVGIYADAMHIPPFSAILMSFLVFAGASQFSAIHLYTIGATSWEIVFTTFMINLRAFLMATVLSRKINQKMSIPFSSLISFGVTDATFALLYFNKQQNFSPPYIFGVHLFAHISWVLGTVFGVFFGEYLPGDLKNAIGIAIYALIIGILVPELRKSKTGLLISIMAISINVILANTVSIHYLTFGWRFILSAILATLIGLFIFPEEESKNNGI